MLMLKAVIKEWVVLLRVKEKKENSRKNPLTLDGSESTREGTFNTYVVICTDYRNECS